MSNAKEPTYATTAAVAGLAREVEQLRTVLEKMEPLPEQVTKLAKVVKTLADHSAAVPEFESALSWLDLPEDTGRARVLLTDLTGWMRDIFLRYPDAVAALPECWMWHPDVVEELVWLMCAWASAYRDDDAPVSRAGDWHDRYRPGVVKRIKATTGTCSLENHAESGSHFAARPVVPVAEALDVLAHWWGINRDEPAPEPTVEQLDAAAVMQRSTRGGRR